MMDTIDHGSILAKNLRKIRKSKGLTQRRLMEITGVGHARISEYENNYVTPQFYSLIELAKGLNVSIDWLVGFDAEKQPVDKL